MLPCNLISKTYTGQPRVWWFLRVMSIVLSENFFMGVNQSLPTLSSFSCYEKDFSAQDHKILFIYSGQYIFERRRNVLAPNMRVWIFISTMTFWWCNPTPQKLIVWSDYYIDVPKFVQKICHYIHDTYVF